MEGGIYTDIVSIDTYIPESFKMFSEWKWNNVIKIVQTIFFYNTIPYNTNTLSLMLDNSYLFRHIETSQNFYGFRHFHVDEKISYSVNEIFLTQFSGSPLYYAPVIVYLLIVRGQSLGILMKINQTILRVVVKW